MGARLLTGAEYAKSRQHEAEQHLQAAKTQHWMAAGGFEAPTLGGSATAAAKHAEHNALLTRPGRHIRHVNTPQNTLTGPGEAGVLCVDLGIQARGRECCCDNREHPPRSLSRREGPLHRL